MGGWGAGCGSRGLGTARPGHRTRSRHRNKSAKAARLFRPSRGLGRAPGDGAMPLLWAPHPTPTPATPRGLRHISPSPRGSAAATGLQSGTARWPLPNQVPKADPPCDPRALLRPWARTPPTAEISPSAPAAHAAVAGSFFRCNLSPVTSASPTGRQAAEAGTASPQPAHHPRCPEQCRPAAGPRGDFVE